MENISETLEPTPPQRRFAGYTLVTLANFAAIAAAGLWASWATTELIELGRSEIVTVELAGMMGSFVEAEARSGNPPEVMKARVEAYLKAVELSVDRLAKEGRTVLVAEAVVAGSAPDFTGVVRADVERRLASLGSRDSSHGKR
jgi:hypothetical protein